MDNDGVSLRFELCLFIEEEYDVSQITGMLGMQPTISHRKNEQFRENKYRKESAWGLRSEEVFSYFFEEELLNFIKGFENALPDINGRFGSLFTLRHFRSQEYAAGGQTQESMDQSRVFNKDG